ncbi:hypothetical protein P4T62_28635 [Bacillus mycoides]|uniref:hypothetical protein n=1 Tax=Bacillus mycoides TaxID=1405 RepID=UPI002E20A2F6|nr:hypothetical protein [Bacillus mycoides]
MENNDYWDKINALFAKVYEARKFEKLKREMEEFEAGFPDGVYAIPSDPKSPRLKVHELYAYCKEHGRDPESLTEKEMEQFLEND